MRTPAEVLDEASEVFGSRARGLLALNLAKAWLSGAPLSASRLASIAGVGRLAAPCWQGVLPLGPATTSLEPLTGGAPPLRPHRPRDLSTRK